MAAAFGNRNKLLSRLLHSRGLILGIAASGLLVILVLVAVVQMLERPPAPTPDRIRAIALFETQNYLSALEALRSLPSDDSRPHAYIGATYLNLHLYQAALEEFEAASRKSPGTLDPWIGLAIVHLKLGDGPAALKQAQAAVNVAGESADAWLVLARAHWFQKDFGQAEQAALRVHKIEAENQRATELLLRIYFEQNDAAKFQELLDRTADPIKPVQDLALQFAVRQGKFSHAYDLQRRHKRRETEARILRTQLALNRDPLAVDLIPNLVRDLVLVGRPEEAVEAGTRYSGSVPLDFELGKAFWLMGDRQRAIQHLSRASAEGTHKLSAEVALAAATGDESHWQEAFMAEKLEHDHFVLAQLELVLESSSPLVKAFVYRYAGLFDSSLFNTSAQHAIVVLDAEPDRFEALMTLGNAYLRLGRPDDALRYIQRACELYPRRAEPWARLGQVSMARQDAQASMRGFETAVLLEPSNPNYLYNLGWLLDQLGRSEEAVPYYERAIRTSRLSFEAMNNMAAIESDAGRSDRAVRYLDQAVASNPENEAAYFNRGTYYADERKWREALQDFETVLKLNPFNAFAAVEQGRIYLELDNTDRALELLNQAVATDPNAREAYVLMSTAYKRMNRTHEADAALAEARRIQPDTAPQEQSGL